MHNGLSINSCFLSPTAVYPLLTCKCFLSGNLVSINKILLSAPTLRNRNPWAYLIDSLWFRHHLCCSFVPSASANKCTVNMKKFAHTSLLGISLLSIGPDSTALSLSTLQCLEYCMGICFYCVRQPLLHYNWSAQCDLRDEIFLSADYFHICAC